MKRALLLLLLLGIAHPAASCIATATDIVLTEQGTLIMVVVGLIVVLIASTYMLGNFFGDPKYTVFAKDEAYHLGFSLIVLIAFSGILVFSCNLMDLFYVSTFEQVAGTTSTCYNSGTGLNSVASCYASQIKDDAESLSENYISNYLSELMDSTFSWSISLPLMNAYTSVPGAYRRITSNQYDMILNSFLVPALMSVSMQELALDFINENAIRWILPVGFVLRVFIPTRRLGNILIAVAFGLYILIPFMFVFNLSMYEAVKGDCTDFKDAVCDNVVDNYCTNTNQACTNPNGFWNVARLIPQAFFLPNLTIAVFITYLTAIDKALRVIG
jgi:glycopeptide antibiotics resistance protein